jgi:hypothetical protein
MTSVRRLCLLLGPLIGCGGEVSQIVVLVDSNLTAPDEISLIAASADKDGAELWSQDFPLSRPDAIPLSFGLAPSTEDFSLEFEVKIEAKDPSGKVVISRRAITHLIKGQSYLLPMYLARGCIEAPACGADETCTETGCAPAKVDPERLPRVAPGDELHYDGGVRDPLDTRITSGPAPKTSTTTATFTFEAAGRESSSFECAIDGSEFTICVSPREFGALAEGSHVFNVRARGAEGDVEERPAEWTWTIDVTAPSTELTVKPALQTDEHTARFEFGANEAESTFECSLDSAELAPCTSPVEYRSLRRGEHGFLVHATDAAGNREPMGKTFNWTIYTFAGGEMLRSATWSAADSPYALNDTLRIPASVTLTIEAGVRVDAASSDDIQIYGGTLNAIGTASERIQFRNIRITRRSPLSFAVGHAHVEFAELEGGGISASIGGGAYDKLTLRSSILRRTSFIDLDHPGESCVIERNVFDRAGGIDVATTGPTIYIRNNRFDATSTAYSVRLSTTGGDPARVVVENNSFMDTTKVAVRIASADGPGNATPNFWNTIDPAVIGAMIHDANDDSALGHRVVFEPFLMEHHPTTPR